MVIAQIQNISFLDTIFTMFKDFLESISENYKQQQKLYNLENNIENISKYISFLNQDLENLDENVEDELLDIKYFIENILENNLPQTTQSKLNKLYEDITMLIFNLSMLEAKSEIESIRN